jgi:hypothetical protein
MITADSPISRAQGAGMAAATIDRLDDSALAVTVRGTAIGELRTQVAEFDVTGPVGTKAAPLTDHARELVVGDGELPSRLGALVDLARSTPAGRLDRLTLATSFEAFQAARAVAYANADSDLGADRIRFWAPRISSMILDAEYLPATGHMLLGPLASNGVAGAFSADVPVATSTRAAYVVAHELAHARRPLPIEGLAQPRTRSVEEARADNVVRHGDLLEHVAAASGLRADRTLLGGDDTYRRERQLLAPWLQARGVVPGQPTAALLDATDAVALVAAGAGADSSAA